MDHPNAADSLRARLFKAALDCFLADDYHRVTTRLIAERTGANVSMTGADLAGASFDMQMFVGCRGRERTLSEWTSLIRDGGMALEEVVRLRSLGSILVLRLG